MKALVVSYVEGITEEMVKVIKEFDVNAVIDIAKDTSSARYFLSNRQSSGGLYDIVVIDMMVQEDDGYLIDPILKPALEFVELSQTDRITFPKKLFALFDPDETGDRGKDEVRELGFAVSNYNFMSLQWRTELSEYLAK